MTTALIAEDEAVLHDELTARLAALWPELKIVGHALNGIDALRLVDDERPDIVFLDIEMPGLTGIEVARQCEGRCHIVFITAYDAHAVSAFEQGAVDYVLKPYDTARLVSTVRRLRERLQLAQPASVSRVLDEIAAVAQPRDYLHWINASVGGEVRIITTDEICYFQSDTKYTRVVTADSETLIRKTLRELQQELDPRHFWPIHRSTVVNANAIAGVSRDFRGRLSVRLKQRAERLAVSEQNEHLFKMM